MRTIKFRMWDKLSRIMYEHGNLENGEVMVLSIEGGIQFSGDGDYERKDFELMQYTGLKDKNGTEIYEGDILDVKDEGHPFVKNWNGIVKFIEGSYLIENMEGTDGEYLYDEMREVEVIGNIFENSDLLSK